MVEPRTRSTFVRLAVLSAVALFLSSYAWWPMFWSSPATPELDGRYGYQMMLIGKATLRNFGEWPMWNPYDCKGIPAWDHPEGMSSSILLLLLLPFGPMTTYYLWNILHMAPGWVGMWLLARDEYRLSRLAAFAAACVWTFGCCHTTQYCGAHESFAALWLFPLALLLWRRAETCAASALGLGALLAFFVYDGATYPLPLTALALGFDALLRVWPPRRLLRVAAAGAITGASAFALSAARLLPLMDQLALHPRAVTDTDTILRWNTLGAMWLHHEPNWLLGLPNQQYVWGEYLSYVGFATAIVAVLGLSIAARREPRLFALSVLVFAVMLGHFAKWAPWTLLREHAPLFSSMRVPSRFRLVLQCFVALFVALAVERVPRWAEERFGRSSFARAARVGVVGLALVGVGDMIGFGFDLIKTRFHGPPPAAIVPSARLYYGGPDASPDFAESVRQNRGWVGCRSYEWPSASDAAIWTGDVPQARATDDGARVEVGNRTSSRFFVDVDVKRPTTILLNSGFAPGWVSSVGTVVERDRMLAVELPPGYHKLVVRYWPRRMSLGVGITAAAAVAIAAYAALRALRRRGAA